MQSQIKRCRADALLQFVTCTPADCYSRTPSQRAAWTLAPSSNVIKVLFTLDTNIYMGDHHQTQLLTYSCPLHGWQNGAEHLPRRHDRRMTLLLSQAGPTVCCFPVHLHYFLCMCMCMCMCMWAHTMNLRDCVCTCIHVGKHPVDTSK